MTQNDIRTQARQHMLQVNERQRAFYEAQFRAFHQQDASAPSIPSRQALNLPSKIWAWLRGRVAQWRYFSGVNDYVYGLHRNWMNDLSQAHVLDLGCSRGNFLSLWIAERCAQYSGVDLSEPATAYLNARLQERGLAHARAYTQDFLANSYPANHFDIIYACAVLHHFKEKDIVLEELYRVLKPGGIIISIDPLTTEPLNMLARIAYRPFQADKDWEWPFTHKTFRQIQNYFEIEDMQGFMGMAKLGLPFYLIPGMMGLGRRIGQWGLEFDRRYARKPGLALYLCWMATLCLRKKEMV